MKQQSVGNVIYINIYIEDLCKQCVRHRNCSSYDDITYGGQFAEHTHGTVDAPLQCRQHIFNWFLDCDGCSRTDDWNKLESIGHYERVWWHILYLYLWGENTCISSGWYSWNWECKADVWILHQYITCVCGQNMGKMIYAIPMLLERRLFSKTYLIIKDMLNLFA